MRQQPGSAGQTELPTIHKPVEPTPEALANENDEAFGVRARASMKSLPTIAGYAAEYLERHYLCTTSMWHGMAYRSSTEISYVTMTATGVDLTAVTQPVTSRERCFEKASKESDGVSVIWNV